MKMKSRTKTEQYKCIILLLLAAWFAVAFHVVLVVQNLQVTGTDLQTCNQTLVSSSTEIDVETLDVAARTNTFGT